MTEIKRASVGVKNHGVTEYPAAADLDVEVGNSLYFLGTTLRDVIITNLDGQVWSIDVEELVKAAVDA